MCGINGIFAYRNSAASPAESELLATRDAMRSRGPDGAGLWRSAESALHVSDIGVWRFLISPSGPFSLWQARTVRYVITFNGEIYNYPSLRKELEADGAIFHSDSDTEALLHLFARHGPGMVRRLRGMYAFAIWDNNKRSIFLARDPYGIKPLYIADDGRTFRFASQVKALLAGGRVSRDTEPAGLVGFYLFGSVPEPFTLYRARSGVAGGPYTVGGRGRPAQSPRPFFSIVEISLTVRAIRISSEELAHRVRDCVFDSVRAHLLSDVEVGLFLSAGVDSGSLLGLMRDAGQRGYSRHHARL